MKFSRYIFSAVLPAVRPQEIPLLEPHHWQSGELCKPKYIYKLNQESIYMEDFGYFLNESPAPACSPMPSPA